MSDVYGPTIAKRRLARRLSQLRQANGYTANQVCDKLDWGRGKVGRFESNAWIRPEMSDVRDLLRLYEKSEDQRHELESLAVRARERPWWRDYGEVFENEFPGYEADATRIRVFVPLVVPGLLQTPAYTKAYLGVGARPSEWQERAVEARQRRQRVLDREDGTAPDLVAVVTEAALLYRWGSQADRRAQAAHLAVMSRRPNVELRMVRFADGPAPGMSGPVTIFDFPGDEPRTVFAETEYAVAEVTGSTDADAYVDTFDRIRAAAAEPAATVTHLEKLATTLE